MENHVESKIIKNTKEELNIKNKILLKLILLSEIKATRVNHKIRELRFLGAADWC